MKYKMTIHLIFSFLPLTLFPLLMQNEPHSVVLELEDISVPYIIPIVRDWACLGCEGLLTTAVIYTLPTERLTYL